MQAPSRLPMHAAARVPPEAVEAVCVSWYSLIRPLSRRAWQLSLPSSILLLASGLIEEGEAPSDPTVHVHMANELTYKEREASTLPSIAIAEQSIHQSFHPSILFRASSAAFHRTNITTVIIWHCPPIPPSAYPYPRRHTR